MTPAVRMLALWLTPAIWLEMPALILDGGPDGVWIGLALLLAPLIALGMPAPAESERSDREGTFPVMILFLVVGVLFWANMVLAGDVAAWLGAPRWQGIAVTAVGAWLLTAWRGAGRAVPLLLVGASLAVSLPLAELARGAGSGPLAAWERVAAQTAFRFPATSAWVTAGRSLDLARGRRPLVFDEEHRVTAPAGGMLRTRYLDAGRVTEMEWTLSPGQAVTLRSGDQLQRSAPLPLRFEAGRRVPGAPVSGMAWATGSAPDWWRRAGLVLTLLLGGAALLRSGMAPAVSRRAVLVLGGALLAVFLWAQGWVVYAVLGAPDLFLGGVTAERLTDLRALAHGAPSWRRALEALLLAGGVASFLASSVALRERLGAMDRGGGGEIGHDLGLWAAVLGSVGLAGLWPVDPWWLVLLALGIATAGLGPATLWPAEDPRTVTAAGLVGLALFAALAIIAQLRGTPPGLAGAAVAYPGLAAAPAGAAVLWLFRRSRRG